MRRFKNRRANKGNNTNITDTTTNTTNTINTAPVIGNDTKTSNNDIERLEEAVEVYKSYLYEIRSGLIYFKGSEEQLNDVERYIKEVDMALENVTKKLNVH